MPGTLTSTALVLAMAGGFLMVWAGGRQLVRSVAGRGAALPVATLMRAVAELALGAAVLTALAVGSRGVGAAAALLTAAGLYVAYAAYHAAADDGVACECLAPGERASRVSAVRNLAIGGALLLLAFAPEPAAADRLLGAFVGAGVATLAVALAPIRAPQPETA